jgi:phospholipid/cholesterol/gamma-HCH transport system substrate-binding protein
VLDIGPAAMGNLHIAFDPESGTIGSRLNFQGNVQDLDNFLCILVRRAGIPSAEQGCQVFKALLEPATGGLPIPIGNPIGPVDPGTTQVRYGDEQPAGSLTELLGGVA